MVADAANGRTAVYLRATPDLSLAGFSFSVQSDQASLVFIPGNASPSFTDTGLPGTVAVAYLEGLAVQNGQRILLGYVQSTDPALRFVGVSANDSASGSEVSIQLQGPGREIR